MNQTLKKETIEEYTCNCARFEYKTTNNSSHERRNLSIFSVNLHSVPPPYMKYFLLKNLPYME